MKIFSHKKTDLSIGISCALGICAATAAADPILSFRVADVGSTVGGAFSSVTDGNSGGFRFNAIDPETYLGVSGWTGDVGTGEILFGGLPNPTGSFSTGFLFAGSPFIPYTFGNGAVGDIDFNNTFTLSSMDFGGNFAGLTDFSLPPDPGTLQVNWVEPGATGDTRLVSFQWSHLITSADDPSGAYVGFNARWIIEGTATMQDLAPTIVLNGTNPIQTTANTTYTDPGAVCQDFVDGTLPVTTLLDGVAAANCDLADTGPAGTTHTCEYQCQDSQLQNATPVIRTIEVVATDTVPPVVTLLVPDPPFPSGIDYPDPSTVNILAGLDYVDAGATCVDGLEGDIPLGPLFTVDPDPPASPLVDTSVPGVSTVTYSCTDSAGNGPTVAIRTVNAIADEEAPVITLGGSQVINTPLGAPFVVNEPPATCVDTNPIDPDPVDISQNIVVSPTTINTSVPGTTIITYTCSDDTGNAATPVEQTVNVVAGQNFDILSMTISDLDGDGLAGCFKFNSLDSATCASANQFSSDNSVTGTFVGPNATIPGSGTDLDDNGNPIGIRFGVFQDTKLISPGFLFSGFPFEPFTFDPPSETASPPKGTVTLSGAGATLLLESMPFSGLYSSSRPNRFFLDPDPGTLATVITADNNDDNGSTRTFNYLATWSHVITQAEDPTGQFINFNAFWRLEGVVTVDSNPVVVNNPPVISSVSASQSGLAVTRIVVETDGDVTVTAVANDPDGDQLSFDWSASDSRINPIGGTNNPTLVFSPAGLAEDVYGVRVTVTDDSASPLSSSAELLLQVAPLAPPLGPGDSDGDGIPDDVEGYGDTDNDGLPNYQDPIDGTVDPTRNRRNFRDPGVGDLVSDKGILVLGDTGFSAGLGQFSVVYGDIAQHGGPGGTSVGNSNDRLNNVQGIGPSGKEILDFTVQNVEIGSTVCVVLPQSEPLPTQPGYRKYSAGKGWADFVITGNDTLGSAKRVDGLCPDPGSSAYDPVPESLQPPGYVGLLAGDDCVRVCITDGGANDGDVTRNGSVSDPGTPSDNGAVPTFVNSNSAGCSLARSSDVAARQRADWWFIIGLMTWVGTLAWRRRRRFH